MFDKKALEFGEIILDEVGLYADAYGRVIDQESEKLLQLNGRTIKFPVSEDTRIGKNDMPFDPLNNPTLSNFLLSYYLQNRTEDYVESYYSVAGNANKGRVEIRKQDGIIASDEYYNDSIKYADLIMRMNGEDPSDLKTFDEERQMKRKKTTKR